MSFDPLVNYGVLDFSNEENLVYWNFSELIKTLITLSKNAGDQLEIMGTNAAATEMALDFDSFYTLSAAKYLKYRLLNSEQMEELAALGIFMEDKNNDEDFWTANALYSSEEWKMIRNKALKLLVKLEMDYLDIHLEKENKNIEMVGGKKQSAMIAQRILKNRL